MNHPPRTPPPPPCPLCQGQRIWAETRITGDNTTIFLRYGRYEPASVRPFPMTVALAAAVCLTCGFTAHYAKDVLRMREEIRQHPEQFDL